MPPTPLNTEPIRTALPVTRMKVPSGMISAHGSSPNRTRRRCRPYIVTWLRGQHQRAQACGQTRFGTRAMHHRPNSLGASSCRRSLDLRSFGNCTAKGTTRGIGRASRRRTASACSSMWPGHVFGPAVRELLDEGCALEAEGGKEAHAEDRGFSDKLHASTIL